MDLSGAPAERFAVGGFATEGVCAHLELGLDRWRFEAPVWFCDPWPLAFSLLGQEGFLRYFRMTICAAQGWLECEPEEGAVRAA